MKIPFAEYAPDISHINDNASDLIVNVYPNVNGYIPSPKPVNIIDNNIGLISINSFLLSDGTLMLIGGSKDKLYRFINGKWIVKGEGYNINTEDGWKFVQFIDDILAFNIAHKPQVYNKYKDKFVELKNKEKIRKDTRGLDIPNDSIPYCKGAISTGDYLMLYGLSNQNEIRWSGYKDIYSWNIGSNNSGYNIFESNVEAISEERNPYVFLSNAIYKLTETPNPGVYSINKIYSNRGIGIADSLVTIDNISYFMDQKGIYKISEEGLISIGYNRIDNSLINKLSTRKSLTKVKGISTRTNRIYWNIKNIPDRYSNDKESGYTLGYDIILDKFFTLDTYGLDIFDYHIGQYSLEDLDIYNTVKDQLYSYDSDYNRYEENILTYLKDDGVYSLIGTNSKAIISSGIIGNEDNSILRINGCSPIVDSKDSNILIYAEYDLVYKNKGIRTKEYKISDIDKEAKISIRTKQSRITTIIPEDSIWNIYKGIDLRIMNNNGRR